MIAKLKTWWRKVAVLIAQDARGGWSEDEWDRAERLYHRKETSTEDHTQ